MNRVRAKGTLMIQEMLVMKEIKISFQKIYLCNAGIQQKISIQFNVPKTEGSYLVV